MIKIALVFPGQGAQYVGMGKEFYETSGEAKEVFDQADAILGNGLNDVVFNGPAEKLTATAYCQPGILTMSLAALHAFKASDKFKNVEPIAAAGLSLGEYSALAAAEVLSLEDTIKLVAKRSSLMEEATKENKGAMAAIIGLEKEKILEVCEQTGAEVANFNSPQQIVITGYEDKVKKACEVIKEAGAKSVIPLDVSGAFHSSLMKPAAEKFEGELEGVTINAPKFSVVSNVSGMPAENPMYIKKNLSKQIVSSVQWVETINNIAGLGVNTFIEIGPGKVLSGLIKRTDRSLKTYNIEKPSDVESLPF